MQRLQTASWVRKIDQLSLISDSYTTCSVAVYFDFYINKYKVKNMGSMWLIKL